MIIFQGSQKKKQRYSNHLECSGNYHGNEAVVLSIQYYWGNYLLTPVDNALDPTGTFLKLI